jgi:hypothetical protein
MIVRNIYLVLLALLGIGAIFGGGVLIISPSGELFGMPLSMLVNSPFSDFLLPGVILFSVLGLMPCWVVWALIKKPIYKIAESLNFFTDMYWAWSFSIYTAFALIIWIQIEMYFVQSVHWSHTLYMFWAIAIIFVALLPPVKNLYKK